LVRLNTFAKEIEAEDISSSNLDMEVRKIGKFSNSFLVSILGKFLDKPCYCLFQMSYISKGLLNLVFEFIFVFKPFFIPQIRQSITGIATIFQGIINCF
jgi:hypothetical protein